MFPLNFFPAEYFGPNYWPGTAACAIVFADFGRQGIGVVQPQSGTDYPLIEPSEDIRYLMADFWLAFDDPADYPTFSSSPEAFKPPFRLAWVFGFGCEEGDQPDDFPIPVHAADLIVVDDDDRVVFDSTDAEAFRVRNWGERLRIFSWETDSAVCRAVIHTAWALASSNAHGYPEHIVPESAQLDERTWERLPRRVKSLTVLGEQVSRTGVELSAGYNVSLEPVLAEANPGGRFINEIEIAAEPGAGQGVYPGCEEPEPTLKTINGVSPTDDGRFKLAATDCYSVREVTTQTSVDPREFSRAAGALALGNDCVPCRSCDDFVDAAKYMNAVRDQYKALGAELMAIRDLYHENRQRWIETLECFQQRPLRMQLRAQYCPVLDAAAQFCNQTDQCVGPLVMTIDFSDTAALGELLEGYTVIVGVGTGRSERYQLSGAWPIFTAIWDQVDPYASVYVKFRLRFTSGCGLESSVSAGDDDPIVVAATLSATLDGETVLGRQPGGSWTPALDEVSEPLACPPTEDVINPYDCA